MVSHIPYANRESGDRGDLQGAQHDGLGAICQAAEGAAGRGVEMEAWGYGDGAITIEPRGIGRSTVPTRRPVILDAAKHLGCWGLLRYSGDTLSVDMHPEMTRIVKPQMIHAHLAQHRLMVRYDAKPRQSSKTL
jgi:hypothetical protein